MNINIEKFLQKTILVGIFAIPFLAFLVPSALFFPFITGKNFAFRIIVEIIFAAWFLLAYYREEYRPKFSLAMVAATSFVGIIFVADLFGANPMRSFWSNYERMEGFVGLIHTFAFFLVAGSVLNRELWIRFFQTFLVTSIFMSFYGFLQMAGSIPIDQGSSRLDGTFGNAAYLGIYMLFNIFLAAYLLARQKRKNGMEWVYWIAIILDFVIMYYTATRGVILGFLVGVALAALLAAIFEKKRPAVKKGVISVFVGIIALVGLFLVFKDAPFIRQSPVLGRLAEISLTESTTQSRFMVWGMAIDGFKEHPILGWGQENFNLIFNKYYNPGMYNQEQWFDRAHDIFFDWLIAGGILGLLAYLSLFLAAFVLIWKPENELPASGWFLKLKYVFSRYTSGEEADKVLQNSILTGLLAAYFINNVFVFDNLYSYIFFFSVLAFLHARHKKECPMVTPRDNKKGQQSAVQEKAPFEYVGSVVFVVFVVVLYFVTIKPIQANLTLIDALKPAVPGGAFAQQNLDSFKSVFDYNTFGSQEAREQLIQTTMRVKQSPIDQGLLKSLYEFAGTQALAGIADNPNDARAEVFAGMLFYSFGDNANAVAHFEKAHELSPKKQAIDFNLVLAYINAKQPDKAFALAKEVYDLDPTVQDSVKMYALAAVYSGQQELSDKILMDHFGTTLIYDDNFINMYALVGRFDRVVQILQLQLKTVGDDPQTELRLAAAYSQMGNTSLAIQTIQDIIKKHPDFEQQGQGYINQLEGGVKPTN